ncbi:MAG TPA: hypothetical protein PLZ55_08380 [bacterium]|nr:hypothetical protein [bacterium]HPO08671.1 hypothetical protein [bacterium]HQO34914.1 hypothetical protein [bacterium]HQP98377.1 hypothetical protein [bacterium]
MEDSKSKEINPKIGKLVAAIGDKRRELGLLEWGQVPLEEVIDRLKKNSKDKKGKKENPQKQTKGDGR